MLITYPPALKSLLTTYPPALKLMLITSAVLTLMLISYPSALKLKLTTYLPVWKLMLITYPLALKLLLITYPVALKFRLIIIFHVLISCGFSRNVSKLYIWCISDGALTGPDNEQDCLVLVHFFVYLCPDRFRLFQHGKIMQMGLDVSLHIESILLIDMVPAKQCPFWPGRYELSRFVITEHLVTQMVFAFYTTLKVTGMVTNVRKENSTCRKTRLFLSLFRWGQLMLAGV